MGKVIVTGKKSKQKTYFRHPTGRPGSWTLETFESLQQRIPQRIIEKAVWGMLPKGRMRREIFHHLKVFKGSEHPHAAQTPIDITSNINSKAGRSKLMHTAWRPPPWRRPQPAASSSSDGTCIC